MPDADGNLKYPATGKDSFILLDQANIWLAITQIAGGSSTGVKAVYTISASVVSPQQIRFEFAALINAFPLGQKLKVTFLALRFVTRVTDPPAVNNIINLSALLSDGTNSRLLANIIADTANQNNFINVTIDIKNITKVSQGTSTFTNLPSILPTINLVSGGANSNDLFINIANAAQGIFVPQADPLITQRQLIIEVETIN